MYLKCGDIESACKVYNQMPVRNVVSWNSMILGLADSGDYEEALRVFRKMKQQYVYGTILDSTAKVTGIIKFDLHKEPEIGNAKLEVGGNVKGIFDLGPGRFGSEAIFVPRQPSTSSKEDDGYLIFFAHDENTGKSAVNVIDAKSMSPDPIAVVELPNRVPYGFHAFFVTEEQLQEQANL
ncbi:Carotenoid 9 [Abeliophyllum distichum]|uniref:carotenoid 9,10-dioxygenase n=1 Tax=Abeliophyllum distichum TaxID=126358 RepID=A0ABD1RPD6_9LAMI